ncbi:hypothetical protein O181_048292 [Austropuccinia psidii MF-1]|uniref:Retrotransposon gag domain-containing protein n=1 Tax=Austropuccinia psidii MF-1 TaxID=1389203 RepID=A0A9Q3DZM0_9BASI|nr:hypothetical protein [Austropuccinia psidii MF-1]
MEGAETSRRGGGLEEHQGEESEETEVAAALEGSPEASEATNLASSNQSLVSQAEPNFLKMMDQVTQFMGQLTQAVSPRDTSRAPEFKTPSMNAPDSFDGTKAYKLREFIQSCQLFSIMTQKTSSLTGRSFCTQLLLSLLLNLFGDPIEVRKAEQDLDNLKMQEDGQASLYIADFRRLMSRIGDWGERAYIHLYRRGLASRLLDQLAFHPGNFDSLQELMEITLELDTSYH